MNKDADIQQTNCLIAKEQSCSSQQALGHQKESCVTRRSANTPSVPVLPRMHS